MRISSFGLMLLTLAPLAACQSAPVPAEAEKKAGLEVLPNMPLPPGGDILTANSSSEALQVIAVSTASRDSVVGYYRNLLGKPPFRLIKESSSPDSVTSFYAEQDGPSLWITVQRNGESGAMVTISGAVTDTVAAAKAKLKSVKPRNEVPLSGVN